MAIESSEPRVTDTAESGKPRPVVARFASAVTWRSLLISFILMPINSYWIVQMEVIRYSAHPTTIALLFNVIFIIFILTLINRLVARFWPRAGLSRAELLFIYSALAINSVLTGHDSLEVLVPMLVWPFRFADTSNNWNGLFGKYLPKSIMVSNSKVYRGYFIGNSTLYTYEHLMGWLIPALAWISFIVVLFFLMLCINSILRKQWTDNERLSYPIIQLPLEITSDNAFDRKNGLFFNRLFWIGFAIAFTIDLINSLNVYYPSVPTILTPGRGQSFIDLSQYVTQKPWYAIGWTPIAYYPFIVGFGMLLPLDFLFSCWFFFIFWKLESVLVVGMGWDSDPRFPYQNEQIFGAYLGIAIYSLWLNRNYFLQVLKTALGRPGGIDDKDEPIRYRWALVGVLACSYAVIWFFHWLGMVWWVAIVFLALYLGLGIAFTRLRAETGSLINDMEMTGPDFILTETMGARNFNAPTLTAFSICYWFNRAYRCQPMPHQLEAFKLAEQSHSEYRRWFWGLTAAAAVGALAGFWAAVHLMYVYGATAKASFAETSFGSEAYNRLAGWLQSPHLGNFSALMAICFGIFVTFVLEFIRIRFPGCPLHPLAFAVTYSFEINLVWLPLFIAWLLKTLILRYSGRQGFQKYLPFFFGLILGEFVLGSFLNIYGIIAQVPTYQFWQ